MLPIAGSLPKIERVYNGYEQHFTIPPHKRVIVDLRGDQFSIPQERAILWELHWDDFDRDKVLAFIEKLLIPLRSKSVGVIIDHCEMGQKRPWRELLALLPEEIPAFLHLEGGNLTLFPFELLDFVHIIWDSPYPYALPVLNSNLQFSPSKRLSKALVLPPKGQSFELVEEAIEERVIAEERLIYDWDGVDELTILPETLSPQGARMVQGFAATGGLIKEFRRGAKTLLPQET